MAFWTEKETKPKNTSCIWEPDLSVAGPNYLHYSTVLPEENVAWQTQKGPKDGPGRIHNWSSISAQRKHYVTPHERRSIKSDIPGTPGMGWQSESPTIVCQFQASVTCSENSPEVDDSMTKCDSGMVAAPVPPPPCMPARTSVRCRLQKSGNHNLQRFLLHLWLCKKPIPWLIIKSPLNAHFGGQIAENGTRQKKRSACANYQEVQILKTRGTAAKSKQLVSLNWILLVWLLVWLLDIVGYQVSKTQTNNIQQLKTCHQWTSLLPLTLNLSRISVSATFAKTLGEWPFQLVS